MSVEQVAREAAEYALQEADPHSPYARAAGAVLRALDGIPHKHLPPDQRTLQAALANLANTLESDLRPEWPNDPEGKQRAIVDKIREVIK